MISLRQSLVLMDVEEILLKYSVVVKYCNIKHEGCKIRKPPCSRGKREDADTEVSSAAIAQNKVPPKH